MTYPGAINCVSLIVQGKQKPGAGPGAGTGPSPLSVNRTFAPHPRASRCAISNLTQTPSIYYTECRLGSPLRLIFTEPVASRSRNDELCADLFRRPARTAKPTSSQLKNERTNYGRGRQS